jgi:hypothetical protein
LTCHGLQTNICCWFPLPIPVVSKEQGFDTMEEKMKAHRMTALFGFMGLVGMVLLQGCGALEGLDYNGEIQLNLKGSITLNAESQAPTGDVHVGLFWIFRKVDTGLDTFMLDSVVGADFPMKFSLDIFTPPPPSTLMTFEDLGPYWEEAQALDEEFELNLLGQAQLTDAVSEDATFGAALIVLWEDTNGSGKFEWEWGPNSDNETLFEALKHGGPDQIVGGAPKYTVIYLGGHGLKDKFYEFAEAFRTQISENIFSFDPGERLNTGYNLLETKGNIVYIPWYANQFSPVPSSSNVDLVISDDLSNSLPHCCGD